MAAVPDHEEYPGCKETPMSQSDALIQSLSPRIVESLKDLGWYQTGKTINLQSVGCCGHCSGEVRVCWDGAILGYFSECGWAKPLAHVREVFPRITLKEVTA